MKNILVLTGGGNSDESVFATAYAGAMVRSWFNASTSPMKE
jgi:hypothetical protein